MKKYEFERVLKGSFTSFEESEHWLEQDSNPSTKCNKSEYRVQRIFHWNQWNEKRNKYPESNLSASIPSFEEHRSHLCFSGHFSDPFSATFPACINLHLWPILHGWKCYFDTLILIWNSRSLAMSQLNGDNNKRSRLEEETILGIDANDDKNNHRFDPDDNGPTKVSKIRRTARKTTVPKRYHPPSPSSDEETGMDSEDDQLGVLFKSREVTISTKNEPAKKTTRTRTTRTRTSRTRTSKVTSSKGRFGVQTILINEPILPSETINRISSIVRSGESSVKEGMIKSYIQEVLTFVCFCNSYTFP